MNIGSARRELFLVIAMIGLGLSSQADARSAGGHGRASVGASVARSSHGRVAVAPRGVVGVPASRGWIGPGAGWWGLVGLGWGWDAAYWRGAYPYYPYYPYYSYDPYPSYDYMNAAPAMAVQPALPAAPPGMMVVAPQSTAPAPVWYYCDSAKSFYPYVNQCAEAWQVVPAVPPAPALQQ